MTATKRVELSSYGTEINYSVKNLQNSVLAAHDSIRNWSLKRRGNYARNAKPLLGVFYFRMGNYSASESAPINRISKQHTHKG
uniref:Uncharacterized protein n=1 Tax=Oryza sativa subsp. japonica TaxID=39947 RepID=Q6YVH5_ORYSJ|nr:hypothetical protein [Oryza sativa Japonica Group]BAD08090.1 hypothetical protein [Oryza sativa Japonica Group]